MFYSLRSCSHHVDHIKLQSGLKSLKTLTMLYHEDQVVSLNGVALAAWRRSMFRHNTGSCYNWTVHGRIYLKLHMFVNSLGLNIWYEFRRCPSQMAWPRPLTRFAKT